MATFSTTRFLGLIGIIIGTSVPPMEAIIPVFQKQQADPCQSHRFLTDDRGLDGKMWTASCKMVCKSTSWTGLCRACCAAVQNLGDHGQPTTQINEVTLKIPNGTVDAVLETAAMTLATLTGEDNEYIRYWLENPDENMSALRELASKLPQTTNGEDFYYNVFLRAKDRPFSLLKEVLALKNNYDARSSPEIIDTLFPQE